MKTKSFVGFCCVISLGITFANQTKSGQTSGGETQTEESDSPWNPLAELLGLKDKPTGHQKKDDLTELFDKHAEKMVQGIKKHQENMDRAMEQHQSFIDKLFGGGIPVAQTVAHHNSAMDAHQKFMDRGMADHKKELSDFNKDWDDFDKDMSDMFKEFDHHFERMSAPFEMRPQQTQQQQMFIPAPTPQAQSSTKEEKHLMAFQTVKPTTPTPTPRVEKAEVKTFAPGDYYDDVQNEPNGTGLPVFHISVSPPSNGSSDEQLPALINHIMDGFKPVLNDLQKKVEDRMNATYQQVERGQPLEGLVFGNSTQSEENSNSGHIQDFMDNVFDSFAQLGSLLIKGLTEEENNTMIQTQEYKMNGSKLVKVVPCECQDGDKGQHKPDCPMHDKNEWVPAPVIILHRDATVLEKKIKLAYVLHALDNVLMGRITKLTYEDYESDLENLLNEGFNEDDFRSAEEAIVGKLLASGKGIPHRLMWSKTPWEVSDINSGFSSLQDMIDEVAPVVAGRLLSLIQQRERQEWEMSSKLSSDAYIGKQLKREFIFKRDNEYEWYEWVIVGLIAGTASLLLLVALFMCVQKGRRCAEAKLSDTEGQNSLSNNNFSDKYKQKIKTLFVNIK